MQPQDPEDWWYLSPEEGQHIAFLSPKTLAYIAHELGMNHYTAGGNFHLLTTKKLSNPLDDSFVSTLLQKVGRFSLRLAKLT